MVVGVKDETIIEGSAETRLKMVILRMSGLADETVSIDTRMGRIEFAFQELAEITLELLAERGRK